MRSSRLFLPPLFGTAALAISRLFPLPALQDVGTGQAFREGRLGIPWGHLLSTPFSAWADLITCNSLRQDLALMGFLLFCYGPFRALALGHTRKEWFSPPSILKSLAGYLALVSLFLAAVALLPRGPSRIVLDDPALIAVDFHSHSSTSWDCRKSFTPSQNAAWHERAGFGGGFVTDHNASAGAAQGKEESRRSWSRGLREYASFEGEEVSLYGAHVVVLANSAPIDPSLYADGPAGLQRFLGEAGERYGGLSVMADPQDWERYWEGRVAQFQLWGAKGFEIYDASPRALDQSESTRLHVIELCRRHNLFMAGASDNHGYGSASCVWNVLRIPGWRSLDPDARQKAVMDTLRREGFRAVRVVARRRVAPSSGPLLWLDAPLGLWVMIRTFTWSQVLVCLGWIWLLPLAYAAMAGLKYT